MSTWRGGYVYRGDLALVALNRQIMAARPHPDLPRYGFTGPKAEAPCGTSAAYRRHRRRGEKPCAVCKAGERLRHQIRKESARRAA